MTQVQEGAFPGGKALIALGSNATSQHGTPRETLEKGLVALDEGALRVVAISRRYQTPFIPIGQGADVVNAVALIETKLGPKALLARLHAIETAFDRARGVRWSDRTLDLDIVAMEDRILPDSATLAHWMAMPPQDQKHSAPGELIVPHPRVQDRAFVLVPAADVAPGWRHPLTGLTIVEMRDALPSEEVADVKVLES